MKLTVTIAVAVLCTFGVGGTRPLLAQTSPFPEVPLPQPPRHSYTWAYVALGTGVGLMTTSFVFANRANHAYRDYLGEVDPVLIERFYDRAVLNDRFSSATLLGGEALIAAGLYLRFLRNPPESRLSLSLRPTRCALALRF